MVRLVYPWELPEVVQLCQPLIARSTHPGRRIVPAFFLYHWTGMLERGEAFIAGRFEEELGLTAVSAMTLGHDLLTGIFHAQQSLVGVHPAKHGFGLRSVLGLAEKEAYARGAKYIILTRANETEAGPRMDRIYEARGYRAGQTTLINDSCLSPQQ